MLKFTKIRLKNTKTKKSVKQSELTVTTDNHSQIISQIFFRCQGSNIHPSQFTCRFPFYEPSGQHLPFDHLFPVNHIKQSTNTLLCSFHSGIFQSGNRWMIIFCNILSISPCHAIILRYSFTAVNNCFAGSYSQSI